MIGYTVFTPTYNRARTFKNVIKLNIGEPLLKIEKTVAYYGKDRVDDKCFVDVYFRYPILPKY